MVIIQGTPIACDQFAYKPGITSFFLSHFHSDHLAGLTPSWSVGKIYCSRITKELVIEKYNVDPKRIFVLDENNFNEIPLDNINKVIIRVKTIPANHCPGSLMFVFQGYFGTFVYSGDFRFKDSMVSPSSFLYSLRNKIDRLYLDNTFGGEVKAEYPGREEVGLEILKIIRLLDDDCKILVAVDTLGKEELLVAIAMECKSLVVLPPERLRTIQILQEVTDLPDVFTTNKRIGRIFALSKREVNYKVLNEYSDKDEKVIGIVPSALFSNYYKRNKKPKLTTKEKIMDERVIRIPYTLHSSFSELCKFVAAIRPKRIFSIVDKDNVTIRKNFGHFLSSDSEPKKFAIPQSVLFAMKRFDKAYKEKKSKKGNSKKGKETDLTETAINRRHSFSHLKKPKKQKLGSLVFDLTISPKIQKPKPKPKLEVIDVLSSSSEDEEEEDEKKIFKTPEKPNFFMEMEITPTTKTKQRRRTLPASFDTPGSRSKHKTNPKKRKRRTITEGELSRSGNSSRYLHKRKRRKLFAKEIKEEEEEREAKKEEIEEIEGFGRRIRRKRKIKSTTKKKRRKKKPISEVICID